MTVYLKAFRSANFALVSSRVNAPWEGQALKCILMVLQPRKVTCEKGQVIFTQIHSVYHRYVAHECKFNLKTKMDFTSSAKQDDFPKSIVKYFYSCYIIGF